MDRPEPGSTLDDVLEHYGVLGMKWGVRKNEAGGYDSTPVLTKDRRPGKKIKTTGGKLHPASDDAKRAAVSKQMARSSTTDSLSNKELQDLVNRMNMEQQYDRLKPDTATKAGLKFVNKNKKTILTTTVGAVKVGRLVSGDPRPAAQMGVKVGQAVMQIAALNSENKKNKKKK